MHTYMHTAEENLEDEAYVDDENEDDDLKQEQEEQDQPQPREAQQS